MPHAPASTYASEQHGSLPCYTRDNIISVRFFVYIYSVQVGGRYDIFCETKIRDNYPEKSIETMQMRI